MIMMSDEEDEASIDFSAPLAAEEVLSPIESSSGAVGNSGWGLLAPEKTLPRSWDPLACSDWDTTPSRICLQRLRRDFMSLYEEPPYGVFAVPDDDVATIVHALVIGPYDTPYEGGFFYFVMRCPPDYPIRPPRVRLLTTADDTVRFNPNVYRDGKVCLSILGTWSGPSWSPAQSISSVLVSIQSLLCENPYHNEPGFDKEHQDGDSRRYSEIIEHETIRVAVCGALEGRYGSDKTCPQELKDVMKRSFPQFYDRYAEVCRRLLPMQGAPMQDPFGEQRGRFEPKQLLERLEALKLKLEPELEDEQGAANDENGDTNDTDDDNMDTP